MLKVYTRMRAGEMNASIYYRLYLPLHAMSKLRLNMHLTVDPELANIHPQVRYQAMGSADIVALYQSAGIELEQFMRNLRAMPSGVDETGERLWPPSFVMDSDDDIFNVDPLNPAYGELGFKRHDGTNCPDGEKIWLRDLQTNQPVLLWSDGENIDFAKNRARLDQHRRILEMCELVSCSTPAVETYIKRESPQTRTFVIPNCIDFAEYPKVELAEHPNEVRVLWQGSTTHWRDLWDIKDALRRVLQKYPHMKLILWCGATHEWLTHWLPKEQVLWIDWVPYANYKLRLNTLNHDIGLAPLKDTVFNRCRSGIKWYENAACWNPSPTLCENTEPYKEIEDGVTGMLYNDLGEFETKLSALIEDAQLRKGIAQNAKDWIKTHRDPSTHAMRLYEEYVKVREERKTWPDPKPEKRVGAPKRRAAKRKKH